MKTSYILNLSATALAAAVFAFSACSKSEGDETVKPENNIETITFGAGRSEGPSTRTGLFANDETKVSWKSGDAVGIWSDAATDAMVTFNMLGDVEGETTEAKFRGDITAGDKYYAIYKPSQGVTLSVDADGNAVFANVEVKTDQSAVAGDFDVEAAPMVAFTTDAERYLHFKNVFSLIKFSTSDFTFTKAKFTSNNTHNALTGKADVALKVNSASNDSEATVTAHESYDDYHSYVTIGDGTTKLGGDAKKYYYFAVMPGTLSEGFTISFEGVEAVTSGAKANALALSSVAEDEDNYLFEGETAEAEPEGVPAISTKSTVIGSQTDDGSLTFPYESDVESLKANGWTLNGHEFVDLGITNNEGQTVYFATMNVGAEKVGDFGDFYQWGATSPLYTTDWVEPGYTDANGYLVKREAKFYRGKDPSLPYTIDSDHWVYKKVTAGTASQRFRKSSKERVIERDNIYTLGTFSSSNVKSYTEPLGYTWETYLMLGLASAKQTVDNQDNKVTEANPCIYDTESLVLKDKYDVARIWGKSWRMPRWDYEFQKLAKIMDDLRRTASESATLTESVTNTNYNNSGKSYTLRWVHPETDEYSGNCGYELTYNNGVSGHNKIFFPSNGRYSFLDASSDSYSGAVTDNSRFAFGRYWASTHDTTHSGGYAADAFNLINVQEENIIIGLVKVNRAWGIGVRPIFVAGAPK